jgi:hypothetical protein
LSRFVEESFLEGKRDFLFRKDCSVPALLVWFRVTLVDGMTISSRVGEADFAGHWSPVLVPFARSLQKGDAITVEHGTDDEATQIEILVKRGGKQIGAR